MKEGIWTRKQKWRIEDRVPRLKPRDAWSIEAIDIGHIIEKAVMEESGLDL